VPGPSRAGELGVTPAQKAGEAGGANAGTSRTQPSVTNAIAPPFFAMPSTRFAHDCATGMVRACGDDHVTGLQVLERPEHGEVVGRPGVAGDRRPAERRLLDRDRLDPVIQRAAAAEGVDHVAVGTPCKAATCRGWGRRMGVRVCNFGASSIKVVVPGAGDERAPMLSIPPHCVEDPMNGPHGWQRVATASRRCASSPARAAATIFDFADGRPETEWTLRRNELAFGHTTLVPRPLCGAATRDLSLTLFGKPLSLPVLVGPTGLAGLFWPEGEQAGARAAAAAGTAYCLSHASVCTLEAVAALARRRAGCRSSSTRIAVSPARWPTAPRRGLRRAGADRRQPADRQPRADLRNGFGIPPRFTPLQLVGMVRQLPWLWRMRQALPRLTLGNYVRPARGSTSHARRPPRVAARPRDELDDVRELRERWRGPLLLKGILHPDEAAQAARLGVDGIIVSNHGGRQLDGAISAIEALPAIVAAVAGSAPTVTVLVDGGIRRGSDVVKALAQGAHAVLIGRPQLWGLAVAGEAGVAHVLDLYRARSTARWACSAPRARRPRPALLRRSAGARRGRP